MTTTCTHGYTDQGPGFYCHCGNKVTWQGCPCGCRQTTPQEYARERKLKDRYVSMWKVDLFDGTAFTGHIRETQYVTARSELEAIRKAGWRKTMGWDSTSAHRVQVIV